MPAFIKTEQDEKIWARAKATVRQQYPDVSEDSDKFWALTTTIYKSMNRGNKSMKKSASGVVARLMAKKAYVPLTPAAQEAMAGQQAPPQGGMPPQDPSMMGGQPPMDPSMMGQGSPAMPPMPMDPSMMGGQPPMDPSMAQGQQMPPIPVVSGPNGEPIDAETGFIVVDFAQGIEQDPMTGILLNKYTGEFMTPEGQPIPPEQAMQMMGQGGGMPQQGDPSMMGGQPPMDPSMMGGQPPMDPSAMPPQGGMPMDPSMMQGQPMMQQTASAEDPMAMMGQGMPMQAPPIQGEFNEAAGMQVDPNTGMPIDPATGMLIDPSTGNLIDPATGQPVSGGQQMGAAPMPGQGVDATQLLENIPGLQEFINNAPKQMESLDKDIVKATHDISGMRTDLQGMRRELSAVKDENRTLYDRMDNCLQVVEQLVGMLSGGQQPGAELQQQSQPMPQQPTM